MTVSTPRRPPRPSDPRDREEIEGLVEALFEEARRAQRRRRVYWAVSASVVLAGVVVFTVFGRTARSQIASPSLKARSSLAAASTSSKIAFIRSPGWRSKTPRELGLFVMNPDGSGQERLTRIVPKGGHPLWSPDGRKIVFTDDGGNRVHLYVMNADGSGLRRLARNAQYPDWSPDGRKIAFVRDGYGDVWESEIYVIDADGSGERRLTSNLSSDTAPAWSPDGRTIAFESFRDGNREIYVMNADGSDLQNLTKNAADDRLAMPVEYVMPHHATWSPDGRTIAFISRRNGKGGIYLMNADGSGQRILARAPSNAEKKLAGDFAWSPDGRQIAFGGGLRGGPLFIVNADGSGRRKLTRTPDFAPAWSPDGRKIAFGSNRTRNSDIYTINADGSDERNLTHSRYHEVWFAWSPAQKQ